MSQSNQIVLILVGLVGSGKTTFAQALEKYTNFRRCNQDDLGNRRRVEDLARQSLRDGYLGVCVDRTNFDASQRAHWIKIARQFDAAVWVAVFDTPFEVCESRLRDRTDHPTLTTPELALSVLNRFSTDYRAPEAIEGYDRIAYFTPADLPPLPYTRDGVIGVLDRVRLSEAW